MARRTAKPLEPDGYTALGGRDVYVMANIMIKRYGCEASLEALARAGRMLAEGDNDSAGTWRRIAQAIDDIFSAEPRPGEGVH